MLHQHTKHSRCHDREQYRVTRPVTFKHLALHQRLVARRRAQLIAYLLLGLSKRKRFGLGEEVGKEDSVMVCGQGVERGGWCEEIGGNELGALMQKLVEGMLAVRACCTPDDGLWWGAVSVCE